MKCLTVREPYASLIMAGVKTIEYRTWLPPAALIGQRIAIHSSQRAEPDAHAELAPHGLSPRPGHVLGTVLLAGVREGDDEWEHCSEAHLTKVPPRMRF